MKTILLMTYIIGILCTSSTAQSYAEFEALSISNGIQDVREIRANYEKYVYEQNHVLVTNIVPTQVVTNLKPSDVIRSAQQLSLMLTNFSDIVAQTGMDYAALKAYAKAHASELSGDQLSKLQAMDTLWADIAPYAPNGLTNFTPQTVTTNVGTTNIFYQARGAP